MVKDKLPKSQNKILWLLVLFVYLIILNPSYLAIGIFVLAIIFTQKKKWQIPQTLFLSAKEPSMVKSETVASSEQESEQSPDDAPSPAKIFRASNLNAFGLLGEIFDQINEASAKARQIFVRRKKVLDHKKKYLQIALNGSLAEAENIVRLLPDSDKIILEVGTPLLKNYGQSAITSIIALRPQTYIVVDTKTADMADRDVAMVAESGANALTCLGVAPIETIDFFIAECQKYGLDAMIDMMNVPQPLAVLKKIKKLPKVIILHRGVDETEQSTSKVIPYYQINQIKGNYRLMLSVAGGDSSREVQSAVFNGADIVVVWKDFVQADQGMADLVNTFLKNIK